MGRRAGSSAPLLHFRRHVVAVQRVRAERAPSGVRGPTMQEHGRVRQSRHTATEGRRGPPPHGPGGELGWGGMRWQPAGHAYRAPQHVKCRKTGGGGMDGSHLMAAWMADAWLLLRPPPKEGRAVGGGTRSPGRLPAARVCLLVVPLSGSVSPALLCCWPLDCPCRTSHLGTSWGASTECG